MADWQGQTPGGTGQGGYGAGYGYGAPPQQPGAVEQAKDRVQHLAGEARQQAGQKLESGVDRGKARAADALGGVAQTLLQSGRQLREQQQPGGEYVERAAQQVQRFSEYLQRTDVRQLVDEVENVARRQPALFLGGMFAVGLIGARFLRSSQRGASPSSDASRFAQTPGAYDAAGYGASQAYGAQPYGTQAQYGTQTPYGSAPQYGGQQQGSQPPSQPPYGAQPAYGTQQQQQQYGAGYGSAGYAGAQYGSDANTDPYASNAYGTGGQRDRDVTGRQPIANEPFGTQGRDPGRDQGRDVLGRDSFRRDDDQRTGGLDPRGGDQS